MAEEVQHHADTFLPTISREMKDVLDEFEPYSAASNFATSNIDFTLQGMPTMGAPTAQEPVLENQTVDVDLESLYALLDSPKPSVKSSFSIVPSKKHRGKPYFINEQERILTTKRNEPVHLQLDNCKTGQVIVLTLRYSDQDFYDRPMICNGCSHSYKGCESTEDHNGANFCVRSRDGMIQYVMLPEGNAHHPAAVMTVGAKQENVDLYVAFKCRNSCSEHKKYGANRTLRLELLDDKGVQVCRNEWSLRVCESAKRDHNLFLAKAGSGSAASSLSLDPRQPVAVAAQSAQQQLTFAPAITDDSDFKPPPMKRFKVKDEPVVHYIVDAASSSSTQQMGSERAMFRRVSPASHNSSGGAGGVESKRLLPIAPPASAVAEAPPAADVVPLVLYPKSEADKKLLLDLAARLDMEMYDLKLDSTAH